MGSEKQVSSRMLKGCEFLAKFCRQEKQYWFLKGEGCVHFILRVTQAEHTGNRQAENSKLEKHFFNMTSNKSMLRFLSG